MRAPLVLIVAVVAHAASGCASTTNVTLPRHDRSAGEAVVAAPTSGVYEVQWSEDGKTFRALRGAERVVGCGQSIGFESHADDRMMGVAGQERFELPHLPRRAKYLVWSAKIRERTPIGHTVAVPVTLAGRVYGYLASHSADAGAGPSRTEAPIDAVMQLQEDVRCAKEESKRESNKLRSELGLPLRD